MAEDEADICEGCGVRDTGSNFNHEGLCKKCNEKIMGMAPEELLKGQEGQLKDLSKNSTEKSGAFKGWKDDLEEVEVRLPIPPGATKRNLVVKVDTKKSSLSVSLTGSELMDLLVVEPLYDAIKSDTVWFIDAKEVPPCVVISLEKKHATMWGSTLCKEGGGLSCWDGASR
jgi:hypothetical protein